MGRKPSIMCPGPPGGEGCPDNNERPPRGPSADPSKSKYRRGNCRPCAAEAMRQTREARIGAACTGYGDYAGICDATITSRTQFCLRCTRECKQVWTWGISTSEKRALFDSQRGLCPCGQPMEWDEENGAGCVIDHSHADGHVRGLLHPKCNMAIGLLGEDAERALGLFRWLATDPHAPIQGHGGQRRKASDLQAP